MYERLTITMNNLLKKIIHFAGIGSNQTGHAEKLVSGLGGFTGILLILVFTRQIVSDSDAGLIVASMGASAVLLFAVPHGPLSQPWALLGGHTISAIIGVTCYLLIPNLFVAAALAVGLAITSMYYLRCIHPPGGATALTAVMAGSSVHNLGYFYLVTPVLVNVMIILSVAILFNYLFHWRRYPTALMQYKSEDVEQEPAIEESISLDDIEHALKKMNLFVDVGPEELGRIYKLAQDHNNTTLTADQIKLGLYYSNGKYGADWAVHQVVDESGKSNSDQDKIIYKVVAGKDRRGSGTITREQFAHWARYEVFLNGNAWQRVLLLPKEDRKS